jgi:hypothetical protein
MNYKTKILFFETYFFLILLPLPKYYRYKHTQKNYDFTPLAANRVKHTPNAANALTGY